jgi:hypothetical protein
MWSNLKKKFLAVAPDVENIIGTNYKRVFVAGDVRHGDKDEREEFIQRFKKLDVQVLKFEEILKEVAENLGTRNYLNPIIKAIQLSHAFLKQI